MKAPILQVKCWPNLVSNQASQIFPDGQSDKKNAIAVLHSRKLVIVAVVNQNQFAQCQEVHVSNFNRNAFNFVIGYFNPNNRIPVVCV